MTDLGRYLVSQLHHRRLGDSTAALAGLATGISVIVGLLTAQLAPRGFHRLAFALHLAHKPLILQLAPFIAGVGAAFGTAAGILKFYSWLKHREESME